MDKLENILVHHPSLRRLDGRYLKTLYDNAKVVRFDPDTIITHEGDEANRFYLISEGRVGLEINVPQKGIFTVEIVEAGELLDWSWIIPPFKSYYTARTITPVLSVAIDGQKMKKLLSDDHELYFNFYECFLNLILKRLQAKRLQLLDLYISHYDDSVKYTR